MSSPHTDQNLSTKEQPFVSLPISDKNIMELVEDFIASLDNSLGSIASTNSHELYLSELKNQVDITKEKIMLLGDLSFEKIKPNSNDTSDPSTKTPFYFINFQWIEQAKAFLILWRDTFFQGQKALVLHRENKAQTNELEKLRRVSIETLRAASVELKNTLQEGVQPVTSNFHTKAANKQIENWELEENPYPVYRKQLNELTEQVQQLDKEKEVLEKTANELLETKNEISTIIDSFLEETTAVHGHAQRAVNFIETHDGKINRIASYLEEFEDKLKDADKFDVFSKKIDTAIENLAAKTQVGIDTHQGLIQYKEINFKRSVRQWLDAEILPPLFEIWQLKENIRTGLKMSFVNISNRAILLSKEQVEGQELIWDATEMSQPLHTFSKKMDTWKKELEELKQDINKKLNNHLSVFSAYKTSEDFLYVPLPNTIRQINLNQSEWFRTAQTWVLSRFNQVQNLITTVRQEESLSDSEKIVRLIQSRTIDKNNHQYSNIFLTKGYIGESFCVGRKEEFQHIKELVDQWYAGYRGAVILSGQRFSGKTLFGDMVIRRFFPKNNIQLIPNETIKLNGRHHDCTYDLGASLEFVRKNTLAEKIMLWIDDLELLEDTEHSLSKNVRALCNYLDNYSREDFLVVSMSNWLKNHLNVVHNIDKKFQAEINLDYMSKEDIHEAISIRHGATHQVLVNEEGEEISPKSFQKSVRKIHTKVEGNIGEALRHWTFAIKNLDDEKVIFQQKPQYILPDFLDMDSAILLAALLKEKRTNEYRLNKVFGKPFGKKYRAILKRLQSVGVVIRTTQGELEVNQVLANDIGRLLEKKQIINFYRK